MVTQPRRTRPLAILAALTALAALSIPAPPLAQADSAPTTSSMPTTVSSDPLPTVQHDGVAWTQVVIGNTVYVGGSFANAYPAGSAPGTNAVPRANVLAYDLTTGALIPGFAPVFNAQVKALAASPDGSIVYAGGNFTQVDGVSAYRTVALNATTGAVITSFKATIDSPVSSLAATATTLYIGGAFSSVNKTQQGHAAAVDARTGAVKPWNPVVPDGTVRAMVVSPDGSKVALGGSFSSVNGSTAPGRGLAMVDAATGLTNLPFAVGNVVQDYGVNSSIYSLWSDGDSIYGTGYVYGSPGNLEGAFRANWSDGAISWLEDCHGDTYSIATLGDAVYTASHAHYCGNIPKGFPQDNASSSAALKQRAIAFTKSATGVVAPNSFGNYFNWAGQPAPTLLSWYPDLVAGAVTGQDQAAWSVTTAGKYVLLAGEFPSVNGTPQAGLVRFALPTAAPNADGPRYGGSKWLPTAVSTTSGGVRVSWLSNSDRDNETLTYSLYRDGGSTPIFTTSASSNGWWDRPYLTYVDSGLPVGSTPSYQVRAVDAFGNTAWSGTVRATVGAGNPGAYAQKVVADGASNLWRFSEPAGPTVYDWAGGAAVTASSGVAFGAAGQLAGDPSTAATFAGTTASSASTGQLAPAPDVFSVEGWFRTTTRNGGKIVGFGNQPTGVSTSYDRHIYMDANGTLHFGVSSGGNKVLNSAPGFNDGRWHQVVGTLSSAGMVFYVDGAQVGTNTAVTKGGVYSGYWRIGGDKSWNSLSWFAGTVDDVAVYPKALTAGQVADHYRAATVAATSTATAAFTTTTTGLDVAFDGSSSSDDGSSLVSWRWDFGDGTTGSGQTAQHRYAASGAYAASLTVTDALGATNTVGRTVTVTAPATGAVDSFSRTVTGGLGTADTGGAWATSGGSSNIGVNGSAARFSTAPGITLTGVLPNVSLASSDVQATVSASALPVGGNSWATVIARRVGTDDYTARVTIGSTGSVGLVLAHGGTTLRSVNVAGLTLAAGSQLRVRVQASGSSPTTVQAKVWLVGSAEPSAWNASATDSTAAMQTAGAVGLRTYTGGAVTNGPLVTAFDDFVATAAQ